MVMQIHPTEIKSAVVGSKKGSIGVSDTFALMMESSGNVAGTALSVQGQPTAAAVTMAAASGFAGSSPYFGVTGGAPMTIASPGPFPLPPGVDPTGPGTLPTGVNPNLVGGANDLAYFQGADLMIRMQDMNMQMLVLQTDVQNVSRQFTTLSNVSKADHEAKMNTLRNVKT
ncbi:MAG: hypothetical protein Q7S00_01400 [bacterium]|nr:hypothetical protein [bacterium]